MKIKILIIVVLIGLACILSNPVKASVDFTKLDEQDQEILLLEKEISSLLSLCTNQGAQNRLYKEFRNLQMEYRLLEYNTGWEEQKYITNLKFLKKSMGECTR